MASAERELITWGLGQSPQRGPGAEPLVRGPPETESILVIGCPTEAANLAPVRENSMFCYGPLVSELGAQSAWCPNPVIGGRGAVPPAPPTPPPMTIGLPTKWRSYHGHRFRDVTSPYVSTPCTDRSVVFARWRQRAPHLIPGSLAAPSVVSARAECTGERAQQVNIVRVQSHIMPGYTHKMAIVSWP